MPAAPDAAFDRFARLVRDLLDVPVALVTLVSRDQQVFPGALGLPEPWQGRRCTPLSHSFCQYVVTSGEALVVEDARTDPLLADNLAIPDLQVIAYAGIPLTARDGTVRGSLCAIDTRPRAWSPTSLATLRDLAAACSSELQLRLDGHRSEAGRSRLALATGASDVGTFDWDLVTGELDWDAPLIAMFGYDEATFDRTIASFNARLHPDDLDRVSSALTTATETGGRFEAEYRVLLPDGTTRWVQGRGRVLADPSGQPARLVGSAYDTTEVHAGDARTTRLLAAMPSGFLSLDPQWRFTVLNPAAEALLGHTQDELAGRTIWEAFPDTVGGPFEDGYRAAVENGAPQTIHAYYPPPLDAWYDVLCWPSPDGLSLFFTDVTARTRADQRAEATAARLALLARVADALVDTYDARAVLRDLPRMVVPQLADACVVAVLGADGRVRAVSSWHRDQSRQDDLSGYVTTRGADLPADAAIAEVVASGRALRLDPGQVAAVEMAPAARAHLDALGPLRATIHPMRVAGRTVGALALFNSPDRAVDSDDDAVSADIADRMAAALEADRLIRARAQLAEDLQRSLLTAPPEPDHAEVVVRYLPAAEAARVGGDWYDAFLQPDGSTMIVIGDVVGHDTVAAAAMGQLRGLLRGIATYSNAGPAEILRGLDAAMQVLQIDTLATATVARFEQTPEEVERGTTRMVWANAGHPPPLVQDVDGTPRLLVPGKADLMLGVQPGAYRAEHVTVLDRGATVLLYTDGLVERRTADLDQGTARLVDAVAQLAGCSLQQLCDQLVTALTDSRADDDIALVAVRLHRQDRPRPREAGPRHVPDGVPAPRHPAQ